MMGSFLPLAVGVAVITAALVYVLLPLARAGSGAAEWRDRSLGKCTPTAIETLREIEFDRETGKLSDADYASLKTSYTEQALCEMRGDRSEANVPPPVAMAADRGALLPPSREVAVCPQCGPRPQTNATYCSGCAQYLPGACAGCGASVIEPAARFCGGCGRALAA